MITRNAKVGETTEVPIIYVAEIPRKTNSFSLALINSIHDISSEFAKRNNLWNGYHRVLLRMENDYIVTDRMVDPCHYRSFRSI
ncbi:hypothetical protein GCM10007094_41440 [Pseudovibrio japonicus]|uniref:Uncharacterized protein n=1 Tax=Pseudovibrio japonicus TaxID=366534 RepID=A0ABQ3EVY6_9HYPH|nr:hypothetical protein GCM10007094_41440 [Pseudovibrio japonicus]